MNTSRSAAGAAMLGGHIYVVGKLGCKVTVYTHMHMYTTCTVLIHTCSVVVTVQQINKTALGWVSTISLLLDPLSPCNSTINVHHYMCVHVHIHITQQQTY